MAARLRDIPAPPISRIHPADMQDEQNIRAIRSVRIIGTKPTWRQAAVYRCGLFSIPVNHESENFMSGWERLILRNSLVNQIPFYSKNDKSFAADMKNTADA